MTEKQKIPYDWKKKAGELAELLTKSRKTNILAITALILSFGVNVELLTDHKPSEMLLNMLRNRKTVEHVIQRDELLGSKVITISTKTLEREATDASKELAVQAGISPESLNYEEIQQESRVAQTENDPESVSYPGDEYIISLSKDISGIPKTGVKPIDKGIAVVDNNNL